MKAPKRADPIAIYARIPTDPDYPDYVILPLYRPHHHHRRRRCLLISVAFLLLAAAACYLIFPADPNLTLVRLRFNRIHIQYPSIDLSLSLLLRVFNRDFFSLNYSSLRVSVEYRRQMLGHVTSEGGHVRARGTSYVNATLDLDGLQVIHDAVYLIEDLAKGSIPLDTDSVVDGKIGIFFFNVPIKARIWCEVNVNTTTQKIIRQDCYPKSHL